MVRWSLVLGGAYPDVIWELQVLPLAGAEAAQELSERVGLWCINGHHSGGYKHPQAMPAVHGVAWKLCITISSYRIYGNFGRHGTSKPVNLAASSACALEIANRGQS